MGSLSRLLGFRDAPESEDPTPPEARARALQELQTPSTGEAAARGAAQGLTFGFMDELQGAEDATSKKVPVYDIAQAIRTLDPVRGLAALGSMAKSVREGRPSEALVSRAPVADTYRASRDAVRERNAAAEEAHPWAYRGGALAGSLATAPLAPGNTAAQAARLGALAGLGGSDADLTRGEVGQAALDTARGAGMGLVAQRVLSGRGVGGTIALGRGVQDVPLSALDDVPAKAWDPGRTARLRAAVTDPNVWARLNREDPIRIAEGEDGLRELTNGNHRLALARELGLPSLPVRFESPAAAAVRARARGTSIFRDAVAPMDAPKGRTP